MNSPRGSISRAFKNQNILVRNSLNVDSQQLDAFINRQTFQPIKTTKDNDFKIPKNLLEVGFQKQRRPQLDQKFLYPPSTSKEKAQKILNLKQVQTPKYDPKDISRNIQVFNTEVSPTRERGMRRSKLEFRQSKYSCENKR